ncbi:MAG: phage tail tape measure protein [Eubacteriales bacterium]
MNLFTLLGSIFVDNSTANTAIDETLTKASAMATTISDKFTSVGTTITNIGTTLLPISTAVSGLGTLASYMSLDFEDAMAKVSTIADTTQVPIEDLETAILNLSNETGIAASDIAENVYNAISAGQDTADAVSFVESATKLSTAGFTESASSLDILTTIMNAYGLEADAVTNVSDILIQTQNLGKTTVDELASSMGKVIPTADASNVSLEQVATSYAMLTSNGIATSEATTYVNSMLNELATTGSTSADVLLNKTGKSFSELMDDGYSLSEVLAIVNEGAGEQNLTFSDMFSSSEAAKAGLVLLGDDAEDFNGILNQMYDSAGSTDEAFGKMQTSSYDLQTIWTKVKNSALELGESIVTYLIPYAEKAGEKVQELSDWFSGLSDEEKENVVQIGLVIAALAPFLIILGTTITTMGKIAGGVSTAFTSLNNLKTGVTTAVTSFTKFKEAMALANAGYPALAASNSGMYSAFTVLTGPIGIAIAAVLLLVAVIATLWNTNEEFRTNIIAIWESIQQSFVEFGQGITDRLNALGFDFENITEVIKAVWMGFCDLLAPLIEAAFNSIAIFIQTTLDVILGIIDFFIAFFTGDWEGCWNAAQSIFESIWNAIHALIDTILNAIKGVIDVFLGWMGTSWDALWSSVFAFFKEIWDSIYSKVVDVVGNIRTSISDGLESAKSTVSDILGSIKDKFSDVMENARSIVSDAIEKIKSYFNFTWSLPTIKLPHFSISGSFSLDPLSTPSFGVEWYKDGGIMTDPTVFGFNQLTGNAMVGGEAGAEAIAPLSTLEEYFKTWAGQMNNQMLLVLQEIRDYLADDDKWYRIMLDALADGSLAIILDGREVGRVVRKYA